jgi:hypothetical protein
MGGFVRKIMPKLEQPRLVAPSSPALETVIPQEEESETIRKRKGRASTILTSPQGITNISPTGRKLLLGE